jgi:hypothetical protein
VNYAATRLPYLIIDQTISVQTTLTESDIGGANNMDLKKTFVSSNTQGKLFWASRFHNSVRGQRTSLTSVAATVFVAFRIPEGKKTNLKYNRLSEWLLTCPDNVCHETLLQMNRVKTLHAW